MFETMNRRADESGTQSGHCCTSDGVFLHVPAHITLHASTLHASSCRHVSGVTRTISCSSPFGAAANLVALKGPRFAWFKYPATRISGYRMMSLSVCGRWHVLLTLINVLRWQTLQYGQLAGLPGYTGAFPHISPLTMFLSGYFAFQVVLPVIKRKKSILTVTKAVQAR